MRFFFPDSQDLVDPSFNFTTERRSTSRLRQRDDVYAHEVFTRIPFDGLLVSKGIVDGFGPGSGGRYTLAQRHRLLRSGVRAFFRLDNQASALPVIGDCGAFTYVREKTPPYSVDEVIDFYSECRFDYGISVDHVILSYNSKWDDTRLVPADDVERQSITLTLAAEFRAQCRIKNVPFEPIGVAQGWSPKSYAHSVQELQRMGYDYIALGGMVPLKTKDILDCLKAVDGVRAPSSRLHLLGVTRTDHLSTFASHGVVSFDSTSPLRQAFKDDKDNYYTMDRTYTAIRVPQVEGNPSLQRLIRAGVVSQERARVLEKRCLEALRSYSTGTLALDDVIGALSEYESLYDPGKDHSAAYRETLLDQPWRQCACDVCRSLDYHVALFRGAERNRRRGFHNVWMFYARLRRELGLSADRESVAASA